MSEETPPPALRLKPRLRPDNVSPPPPPVPAAAPATAVAEMPVPAPVAPAGAVVKAEPPMASPAPVAPPPPPVAPSAVVTPVAPPPSDTTPTPQVPTVDPAFFKLKPRVAPANQPASAANAPPPPNAVPTAAVTTPAAGVIAPQAPVTAPAPTASSPSAPPPPAPTAAIAPAPASPAEANPPPSTKAVVSLRPATKATTTPVTSAADAAKTAPFVRATPTKAPATTEVKPAKVERPENSRAFKVGVWAIGAGTAVALSVGGFMAFRYFLDQEKESSSSVTSKPATSPTPEAKPTAAAHDPVVDSPQSLPGKMVDKARDTVAAREASGQVAGVNEVLEDPPEGRSLLRSPSAQPSKTLRRPSSVSGDVVDATAGETSTEHPDAPPPSAAFRSFVGNLRVSGVFQGNPGRALINGRTIRVGEVADRQLGIWLSRLDADRKILYFEDQTGASMQRRY